MTLRAYAIGDGAQIALQIPDQEGTWESEFSLSREGDQLLLNALTLNDNWQLLLVGIDHVATLEGASSKPSQQGLLIRPTPDSREIHIRLK